jgi:hypothetical protein
MILELFSKKAFTSWSFIAAFVSITSFRLIPGIAGKVK